MGGTQVSSVLKGQEERLASENGSGSKRKGASSRGALEVARKGVGQLTELTGRKLDTIAAIERVDDGWQLTVELVELERVPSTTNLMGSYDAELDAEGNLISYERVRRYHRGQADEL